MRFRRWVIAAVGLFVIGMAIGLIARGALAEYLAGNLSSLRQFAEMYGPFRVSTVLFIFTKNVSALALSFALSPLLLIFPVLVLTLNGALIAFVAAAAVQQASLGLVLVALLPHGLIELTAVMIGEAAALHAGAAALAALALPGRRPAFLNGLKQDFKVLAFACFLLLPAALIEAFITPLLVGY